MTLAFTLFKYSPYGGLQRDFMAVARSCLARGHKLRVYCWEWQGEKPVDMELIEVPVSALSNHRRQQQYVDFVQAHLREQPVDCVIGFNRMPGLDIYFASDNCFAAKNARRNPLYKLTPRYRHFIAFEQSVLGPKGAGQILIISPQQRRQFQQYYQTDGSRFTLLPPGIPRDRVAPPDADVRRAAQRKLLGLADDQLLLVALGSGFRTKGLDRSITALAALPVALRERCQLHVLGNDRPKIFARLADRLGIAGQVHFMGGRDDVPDYLLAADLLIHPARNEAGGMALLEAAVAGVPVLASEVCGFAHYIAEHDCGCLLREPFEQAVLNRQLEAMLTSERREQWRSNGLAMAQADIFDQAEKVVAVIERWAP